MAVILYYRVMEHIIRQQITAARATYTDWHEAISPQTNIHIAVMSEPFLTYVFNGKKTVESRFSLHKVAPFNKVHVGDSVLLKAGLVVGCFTVGWVKYFDLTSLPIQMIAANYNEAICGSPDFWRGKSTKRYATLVGVTKVRRLTSIAIKKRDRRGWVSIVE